jgi:hypothetical protein
MLGCVSSVPSCSSCATPDLPTHEEAPVTRLGVAEATVAARVRAVMSFYRYRAACGGPSMSHLYEQLPAMPRAYLPFLTHVARRHGGQARSRVPVRVRRAELPIVTPPQTEALMRSEGRWDTQTPSWAGDLQYRLFWSLLAETGVRLGEAIWLQHQDWRVGRGSTAAIAIVPIPHPHGLIPSRATAASTSAHNSIASTATTSGPCAIGRRRADR